MGNIINAVESSAEEKKKGRRDYCFTIESAQDIQQSAPAPRNDLIDGILPPGLTLLAGPRKKGKSWLALLIAVIIAGLGNLWGRKTRHGKVLYFALEDNRSRIHDRLNTILDYDDVPKDLDFAYSAGATGNIFFKDLDAFLQENPDIKLVIIDVLQKIRPDKRSGQTEYAHDYEDMGKLKDIALKHDISILAVTHTRKTKDPYDKLNEISGGTGVTAAADTILMIGNKKSNNDKKENTLSIIGRDIPEAELVIVFDPDCCMWKNMGTIDELNIKKEEELYESSPIVKAIKILLARNNGRWEGTCRDLLDFGAKEFEEPIAKNESALARKINMFDALFEKDFIIHIKPNPNGGIEGRKHLFYIINPENTSDLTDTENSTSKLIDMADIIPDPPITP